MQLVVLFTLLTLAAAQSTGTQIAGVWRGESICASSRGACVDEKVVYYIRPIAEKAGVVSIRADKIVSDHAVTMGTGEWKYDVEHLTRSWRLSVRPGS